MMRFPIYGNIKNGNQNHQPAIYGGFQLVMGNPKLAGWFTIWKIPSFEMDDDWGYPYFRKPPYSSDIVVTNLVFKIVP